MTSTHTPSLPLGIPPLSGRFSFRLGATSYVVPADLLPNIEALAGLVDDVEVVLFESEAFSNLPGEDVIERMAQIGQQHGMSFTIHFPLDVSLGDADEDERVRGVHQCLRIVELTRPLLPFGYVLHLMCPNEMASSTALRRRWQERCVDSVKHVLDSGAVAPGDICVENLSYPFEYAYPVVEMLNLSVCMDVGHVLMNGYDYHQHFQRYWERTRVMHLHGLWEGADHCALTHLPKEILGQILENAAASDTERVLTMEVFGTDNFVASMGVMKGMLP
ncbi:MAG: sugar phosphate isomerase/epimerase [Deltaproteobacteria bacterium]|nr:sugar phosphate isomerase/epimerase [Deltaproteobacteria bacterium]